jgi:hypothetical protein
LAISNGLFEGFTEVDVGVDVLDLLLEINLVRSAVQNGDFPAPINQTVHDMRAGGAGSAYDQCSFHDDQVSVFCLTFYM